MYRVTHVTLHNICQYADADFDVDVGLTAVCGRNGNGKTNLLRALVYGLTGLVDGGWGSQQTLQKDGTVDPGYVSVTITGESTDLIIRRFSMSGPKFPDIITQTVDGKQVTVASRRKEVDTYLEGVFGIPCSLLFQICWGRQNQLPALLTAPSAIISNFLSNVFNTKYLETIREKIKTILGTIAAYDEVEPLLLEYRERLNALPDISDLEASLAEQRTRIEQQRARCTELQARSSDRMPKEQWETAHSAAMQQVKSLEDQIKALNTAEAALLDRDTTAYETMLSQIAVAITKTQEQSHELNAAIGAALMEKRDLEDRLSSYEDQQQKALAELESPVEVCSRCGAKISDVAAYRRQQCLDLTGFETIEAYKADMKDKCKSTKADLVSCVSDLNAAQAKLKELQTLSKTLTGDSETIHSLMMASRRRDRQKLLEGQLELANERLSSVEAQQPMTEEESRCIQEAQAALTALESEERANVELLASTKTSTAFLETEIQRLELQQQQAQVNANAREALTALRDVLSRDRAQARYLDAKIEEINERLGIFMRGTDLPFSLRLNPQTHLFEYTTVSGHVHPAGHLSGAQLNISAVLLQMAIFEVVQPQINLFLVDEPSEALDDQNKTMMAGLFQRMNNLLPAIEGVMLIVTRDWQLIDSCTNQINIET